MWRSELDCRSHLRQPSQDCPSHIQIPYHIRSDGLEARLAPRQLPPHPARGGTWAWRGCAAGKPPRPRSGGREVQPKRAEDGTRRHDGEMWCRPTLVIAAGSADSGSSRPRAARAVARMGGAALSRAGFSAWQLWTAYLLVHVSAARSG